MSQPLDPQELKSLPMLISKALDGTIDCDEIVLLENMLKASDQARLRYRAYLSLYNDLECILKTDPCTSQQVMDSDSVFDIHFWEEMAENEKNAPSVEVAKEASRPKTADKVVYEEVPPKVNKFSLITAIACAAALLFLLLFTRFADPSGGQEVATIADSLNAKWAPGDSLMLKDMRLSIARKPLTLRQGIIELQFDNRARVIIEAPAEFQILAEDRVGLTYGKLYSKVPKEAIGFSVYTPYAKIVDLGTEFGVQVELNRNMQLHVLEGKTLLMAEESDNTRNIEVNKGTAKKVSGDTQTITDIPCDETRFVRAFDSQYQVVWRDRPLLDLADIVGGGNGFGTGKANMTIDPISGKLTTNVSGRRESANDYHPVPSSSYIDGVFVPNGRKQQMISSQGHQFQECPVTSGLCCFNISYEQRSLDLLTTQNSTSPVSPVAHTLLIHANMGITFDLRAIRRLLPDVSIVRFQSKVGIRGGARPSISNADFWVLVDGKIRYQKEQVKVGEFHDIDIELSEDDRFLTLIETDGGDPEKRIVDGLELRAIDSDWGVFVDPVLVLEWR